jgi:hypothetical protein
VAEPYRLLSEFILLERLNAVVDDGVLEQVLAEVSKWTW